MADLIKALTIFLKYSDTEYPTNCAHDELSVCVDPALVSEEDLRALEDLGFFPREEYFASFRFGSC
jgi:hypothetical protein